MASSAPQAPSLVPLLKLNIRSKRHARLVCWMLLRRLSHIYWRAEASLKPELHQLQSEEPKEVKSCLLETLRLHYLNDSEAINVDIQTVNGWVYDMLPDSAFLWLKKDKFACFWLWELLRRIASPDISLMVWGSEVRPEMKMDNLMKECYSSTDIYSFLELPHYPSTHEERLFCIIHFFDRLPDSRLVKQKLMDTFIYRWGQVVSTQKSTFLPLERHKTEKIEYAWGYFFRRLPTYFTPVKDSFSLRVIDYYSVFPVFSSDEKYIVMQLVFLSISMEEKKRGIFRRRLLKSWHITHSRENMAGKPRSQRPKKSNEQVAENQSQIAVDIPAKEAQQEAYLRPVNHSVTPGPEIQDSRTKQETAQISSEGQYQTDPGTAEKHRSSPSEVGWDDEVIIDIGNPHET